MRLLDLFSGSHSVGSVARKMGYEVTSLDLHDADINCDVLQWDYKAYSVGHFDVIWASIPCETFSKARTSLIGRFGYTRESLERDIQERGVPLLRRTLDILDYFQPKIYFIENPQTGRMKDFIQDRPYYDVDYCRYGFKYKKRTRIWTNLVGFSAKLCDKQCGSFENGRHTQIAIGSNKVAKGLGGGDPKQRAVRHIIPPQLIHELFILCNNNSDATA